MSNKKGVLTRKMFLWLGTLISLCVFSSESISQNSPSENQKLPALKVLSWNIYMLPPAIKFTGKRVRAKVIGEILKSTDYQVIVFQEAFPAYARRIIRKEMREAFPCEVGPLNHKPGSLKANGGIWMLSKIPLKLLEEIDYEECSGIDCWARKGALFAEGEWAGVTFQVLGTHLQAGGTYEIKYSEYAQLQALLKRHERMGVPQILCGDFNTNKTHTGLYNTMMNRLGGLDGELSGLLKFTADGVNNDMCGGGKDNQKVIDYIFYKENGVQAEVSRKVPIIRQRWSNTHRDLSDHFPVEAVIQW